jgi:hypothetical protein
LAACQLDSLLDLLKDERRWQEEVMRFHINKLKEMYSNSGKQPIKLYLLLLYTDFQGLSLYP